jgi:rhodanese-related sulfurtransferase
MATEVEPDEVAAKAEDGELQVIDIRQPGHFEDGHVPGAENVPMPELPQRLGDVDWEDEVVVVCPIGQSSVQAARLIESYEGVDDDATVASMAGGYDEYDGALETGD